MAFGYIGRLYPRVTAFEVLKTTEGFEAIPSVLALAGGIGALTFGASPLTFGLCIMIGKLVGGIGNAAAQTVRIPPLVKLCTWISYANGFGLMTIVMSGMGYYVGGWVGVAYYIGGSLSAEVILWLLDLWLSRMIFNRTGVQTTWSERNFLASFMYHARRVGENSDLRLDEEECEEFRWAPAFMDLARRWPRVIARFDKDDS